MTVVKNALDAAGLKNGEYSKKTFKSDGHPYKTTVKNRFPKSKHIEIEKSNTETKIDAKLKSKQFDLPSLKPILRPSGTAKDNKRLRDNNIDKSKIKPKR